MESRDRTHQAARAGWSEGKGVKNIKVAAQKTTGEEEEDAVSAIESRVRGQTPGRRTSTCIWKRTERSITSIGADILLASAARAECPKKATRARLPDFPQPSENFPGAR